MIHIFIFYLLYVKHLYFLDYFLWIFLSFLCGYILLVRFFFEFLRLLYFVGKKMFFFGIFWFIFTEHQKQRKKSFLPKWQKQPRPMIKALSRN